MLALRLILPQLQRQEGEWGGGNYRKDDIAGPPDRSPE